MLDGLLVGALRARGLLEMARKSPYAQTFLSLQADSLWKPDVDFFGVRGQLAAGPSVRSCTLLACGLLVATGSCQCPRTERPPRVRQRTSFTRRAS
jgi:hypothetical protein